MGFQTNVSVSFYAHTIIFPVKIAEVGILQTKAPNID